MNWKYIYKGDVCHGGLLCFVAIAMSELLFECYSVPSVAYGVDALFSYQYNCVSPTNNGMYVYTEFTLML